MSSVKSCPRTAVFISGGGSTLQALLEMNEFFKTALVISNRKRALGAVKAKRFGVPTFFMDKQMDFEQLHALLLQNKIDQIFLAGFMKILPEVFIQKWQRRIFNIHPSLLPHYKGLEAFERAYADKAECGVTIHHVVAEMDAGEKILQQKISPEAKNYSYSDAALLLRRTEQNLLRTFALRKAQNYV